MPLQEFKCSACGVVFEDLVGTFQNYPVPTNCKGCGSESITKLMSGFAVKDDPFNDPGREADAMKNKKWLESIAPEIKSGERSMKVPKGFPSRFQPEL